MFEIDNRNDSSGKRRLIFGFRLSELHPDEIAEIIFSTEAYCVKETQLIVTPNVDHIVRLQKDALFREIYRYSSIITADGFPVVKYACWQGYRLENRVTGHDILASIIKKISSDKRRIFFVVNSKSTAEGIIKRFNEIGFPEDLVGCESPPMGFEKDESYCKTLVNMISQHQPNILVLGVGCPKSEKFVYQYRKSLNARWAICVGDAVSVWSGTSRRAPEWAQKYNLEWAWRVKSDPRRLLKRYFWDSRFFIGALFKDIFYS